MKTSRKTLLALIGAMAMGAAMAAPSVEIVSVQQQYPWTNTVDIVYNVAGVESETNGYFVVFTPTTSTGAAIPDVNGETSVQVALKGSGVYSTQWFPQTNQQYTACKMTPSVFRGAAKDYMIVDLDTGDVWFEPMATQAASNERYNTTAYKTRYLVLRRIEGGRSYAVGGASGTGNDGGSNPSHQINMPSDYYAGIFEVTVAQYERLTETANPGTSTVAKEGVSWNTMRGSALSNATPSSGPLANLNAKTGLKGFDLPTSDMWEVAARAGVKTSYLWGDELTASGRDLYGWWNQLATSAQPVGLKLPNAWGLYDVHGNVTELTLDWFNKESQATLRTNGQTPITTGTSSARMTKGDSVNHGNGMALQGIQSYSVTDTASHRGFRLFYLAK